ncbi:conserved hypothetical protein [Vibrio crassostreae]|nr:hypothetical protein EDB51_11522 [Vibrio crassostreae]CAK1762822.1 conserved hypothetical protein [Vibrio crassostreae]CAK1784646.1 conserved hypothetical protein [Vibrio crassostreae]CAK2156107.1 conserved hypothetical protein [Vibrio crassostreae]CAK2555864.1 conserved hypothetical protein [Vibrio crassostreae]
MSPFLLEGVNNITKIMVTNDEIIITMKQVAKERLRSVKTV